MSAAAQQELAVEVGDSDCVSALAELVRSFSAADIKSFKTVSVDKRMVAVANDTAVVPAAAVAYSPGVNDNLRFHRDLALVKTSTGWQFESVVENDLNH